MIIQTMDIILHLFYEHNLGASHSYGTVSELLKIIKPNVLIRIKGNLYPSTSKIIEHSKHTDFDFKHKDLFFI